MNTIADTHCHFYDCYDAKTFLDAAIDNLNLLSAGDHSAGGIEKALFLCERAGQRFFNTLFSDDAALRRASYRLTEKEEELYTRIGRADGESIMVVNGRQIIAREGIEVLALGFSGQIRDGVEAAALIEGIRDAGGIPVLCWSPGKWFFKRGELIEALAARYANESICLGDISMRSYIFPEPRVFSTGRKIGIPIIAGSDPLPRRADQGLVGRYAALLRGGSVNESGIAGIFNSNAEVRGARDNIANALIRLAAANLRRRGTPLQLL